MVHPQQQSSEVAQLREQITLEYQATQRIFLGFTPTARHQFITARMERMAACHEALKQLVGEQEATHILCDAIKQKEEGRS